MVCITCTKGKQPDNLLVKVFFH